MNTVWHFNDYLKWCAHAVSTVITSILLQISVDLGYALSFLTFGAVTRELHYTMEEIKQVC